MWTRGKNRVGLGIGQEARFYAEELAERNRSRSKITVLLQNVGARGRVSNCLHSLKTIGDAKPYCNSATILASRTHSGSIRNGKQQYVRKMLYSSDKGDNNETHG